MFWFTPTEPIDPVNVQLNYDCANTQPAPITVSVNTILLSASAEPVPDIVCILATVLSTCQVPTDPIRLL